MEPMPALSLVAVPGRRYVTLELAREVERRGFTGIYLPSMFGNLAQCGALAMTTRHMKIATAVTPIYGSVPEDFAQTIAYLDEISNGRFAFGIGVAHTPRHIRIGATPGKPLGDIRAFVEKMHSFDKQFGTLPPIILAALRKRMVALAGEIAEGLIFANASLSHVRESLSVLPDTKRADPNFLIANMIPVCISDDVEAAKQVNRRRIVRYAMLANYRNYWKEAGYVDEMTAIETAITEGRESEITSLMSDRWLDDATLSGSAARVREGIEAWREAGITTPVIVPYSASGNQFKAVEELFAAFA
jgi:alkanesulfonate monooxygenase SsuD/methylene tetrahydromethanopterin reductase-like flavin-dependent oxidoreductase (luciferase family)